MPAHKPGQYTTLGLGFWEPRFPGCQEETLQPGDETKLARRSYSISCSVLATGTMLLAFLSLTCGLILDTVTLGRRELKRMCYLAARAPGDAMSWPVPRDTDRN